MTKHQTYQNFIGGRQVASDSGLLFSSHEPANPERLLGVFQRSTPRDIDDAIAAAVRAQPAWARVPAPARGEILRRAAALLIERSEAFGLAIAREVGKPLAEAQGYELHASAGLGEYIAGEGRRLFGVTTPSEHPDKFACTTREPIGVVGVITPWNLPLLTPAWKIFPALLCGNAVVFKPAEDTPLVGLMLAQVFEDAGLPAGVLNVVTGYGHEIGQALCADPRVKLISFTGSTAVGRLIGATAGGSLKKVALELGGKNAIVVADDADLDLVVEGALWGGYGTAGQRCTASSRIVADRRVAQQVVERLAARVQAMKIGDPTDRAVTLGPLINQKQHDRVQNYIEVGRSEGARLVTGGQSLQAALGGGYFFQPTIFDQATPSMRIAREEIFGPVVTVLAVDGFDEAVRVANDTDYGLSLSVYTQDVNRAFRALRDFHSGIAYVNAPTIGSEFHLPFGGVGDTGNGHREVGPGAIDLFSEVKTIFVDYSGSHRRSGVVDVHADGGDK